MSLSKSPRIFISYSHRGKGPTWKAALLRALQVFEKQDLLDVWQDGRIRVSSFWDDDIKTAMKEAALAVVLLTKETLRSKYILSEEFPFLRNRQRNDKLAVFPVVCEPCDWHTHDWLRATQAPNASSPLSKLPQNSQDRVFRQLATALAEQLSKTTLAEFRNQNSPSPVVREYLERFPLSQEPGLRESKLIGREQEIALLDLAFAQPHTSILSLVAWGGVGKTMLVQHWLQRLRREGWFGASRVYAWSFFSQGTNEDRQASEDMFLSHSLNWFGVQCEPTLSPWEKGRMLADAIVRDRTLLILDGIEPLQYPPGPMGGQLRAPGVQSLLKQLARKVNDNEHSGLCLVTTREPLVDLADFERRPYSSWGTVLRVDLGNLTEEAGADLLHHAGAERAGAAEIKADDSELFAASREVDGHALTLNLLGRFLARAHQGDIRRRKLVKFREADRIVQGGTTFKMLAAFERWFAKSGDFGSRPLAILRVLGLFDRPADFGCIAALREVPSITGITDPLFTNRIDKTTHHVANEPLIDEEWNTATSFLTDFGLIAKFVSDGEFVLDCHPLVREHFARQVRRSSASSWRTAQSRLYSHLLTSTSEGSQPTLEDLLPLYHAIAHGCHAGLEKHAHHFVYLRIKGEGGDEDYPARKLGAFGTDLSALASFFDCPWSRPSQSLGERDRAMLLNNVAFRLRAIGRLAESIEPMQAGLKMGVKQGDWSAATKRSNNLSDLLLTLGQIRDAVKEANNSVYYAYRTGDVWSKVCALSAHADALHQVGHPSKALARFNEAEELQGESFPEAPILFSYQGFQLCDLLLAEAERGAWQYYLADGGRKANGTRKSLHHTDAFPLSTLNTSNLFDSCSNVAGRPMRTLVGIPGYSVALLDIALDHLTLGRAIFYAALLDNSKGNVPPKSKRGGKKSHFEQRFENARKALESSLVWLRRAGQLDELPRSLLTRAWLRSITGSFTGPDSAQADLDEAWEIVERGPMRLHMADIHLHRARLFYGENRYPWKSPHDDLAAAEKIISSCGYHRRDEELAVAKATILP